LNGDDVMSRTLNARAALRAVRRYLVVPLVGVGIGIAAAQSLTGRIPPTYATDASVVITASTVDPTTRAKVADLALAQGLAPTVAQLVESREVALFTAASLKLPPGAVAGHVKGSYQRGTQVVTIRATAPSATGASTIANAAARATMRQFALLQVGVGGNVAIQLLDQASPPAAPRSPDRRLYDAAVCWTTASCCWAARPGSCSRGSGPVGITRSLRE
jgi:capsular polysaccharide biosynthesis protein